MPGLGDQRRYARFLEGVRLHPTLWTHLRPSYSIDYEQFVGGAERSFARWTIDLSHELPFYRSARPTPRAGNTPNDCSISLSDHACPSPSRDRYGALSLRVVAVGSSARASAEVPFYFQPTLGGSNIDGSKLLSSFDDYRFRASNLLAMQLAFEHALFDIPLPRDFSLPLGGFIMTEQGRVGQSWEMGGFRRSHAAGLTIRVGGFPEIFLLYAWGSGHGRFVGSVNAALLGGAPRPSLQ